MTDWRTNAMQKLTRTPGDRLPWELAAIVMFTSCLGASLTLAQDLEETEMLRSGKPVLYRNSLKPIPKPAPLLADHPEYIAPVVEMKRLVAPPLISDPKADLTVKAWRWSYNARGIIEMLNSLDSRHVAVVVVHPWGLEDGQGWRTPEPAGVAFFCTPEKNRLGLRHAATVLDPFLKRLRGKVKLVAYSLPGVEDPIRRKLYRSTTGKPNKADRAEGAEELARALHEFRYEGQPLPSEFPLSSEKPVADYFAHFPGLDSSDAFEGAGFWSLPIPVMKVIDVAADDVVFYDGQGYEQVRDFLMSQGIRHILLTGYCLDMCVKSTTCGYENLCRDFNVFIVADATLATFPAAATPAHATNAAACLAALDYLITQVSWVKVKGK